MLNWNNKWERAIFSSLMQNVHQISMEVVELSVTFIHTIFMQRVNNRLNTYGLLDSISMVSFIDKFVRKQLGAEGTSFNSVQFSYAEQIVLSRISWLS